MASNEGHCTAGIQKVLAELLQMTSYEMTTLDRSDADPAAVLSNFLFAIERIMECFPPIFHASEYDKVAEWASPYQFPRQTQPICATDLGNVICELVCRLQAGEVTMRRSLVFVKARVFVSVWFKQRAKGIDVDVEMTFREAMRPHPR